jgi:D-glycero-D-manno-heptose 1,7-bisphosphate phosphatase
VAARPPVLLDRDGTIVVDTGYPRDPDLLRFLPGAAEALRELTRLGHPLAVVSNQSGVGRGLVTRAEADAVHRRFLQLLTGEGIEVAGAYYCFHAPDAGCDCRKPQPGLLTRAVRELGLGAPRFMVGDKLSDVAAGAAAGCTTVWLGWPGAYPADEPAPDFQAADWPAVLAFIRERTREE